jgi:ABC-type branched-subunit amino acid transport system ATPase component
MPTSPADHRAENAYLSIRGVAAGYGSVPIIRGVDLHVAKGEIVTVIGPNGAGKTTLLKTVVGILTPMEGTITLGGQSIGGQPTDRIARMGVGYVPQVKDVFETLTVRENLEMGGYTLPGRAVEERLEEIYKLYPALGEMRSRHAGNLSGGERKMLAMGRVLMTRPGLLVLDEPTAGLSPQLTHELLRDHVTRLASTDIAILLVEQHAREALAISDWACVMASGEVQMSDRASTLLGRSDVGEIFLGRTRGGVLA